MPVYEFECETCGGKEEKFLRAPTPPKLIVCEGCGGVAKLVISLISSKPFVPYIERNLGGKPVLINSKKQLGDECKKRGVTSVYLDG